MSHDYISLQGQSRDASSHNYYEKHSSREHYNSRRMYHKEYQDKPNVLSLPQQQDIRNNYYNKCSREKETFENRKYSQGPYSSDVHNRDHIRANYSPRSANNPQNNRRDHLREPSLPQSSSFLQNRQPPTTSFLLHSSRLQVPPPGSKDFNNIITHLMHSKHLKEIISTDSPNKITDRSDQTIPRFPSEGRHNDDCKSSMHSAKRDRSYELKSFINSPPKRFTCKTSSSEDFNTSTNNFNELQTHRKIFPPANFRSDVEPRHVFDYNHSSKFISHESADQLEKQRCDIETERDWFWKKRNNSIPINEDISRNNSSNFQVNNVSIEKQPNPSNSRVASLRNYESSSYNQGRGHDIQQRDLPPHYNHFEDHNSVREAHPQNDIVSDLHTNEIQAHRPEHKSIDSSFREVYNKLHNRNNFQSDFSGALPTPAIIDFQRKERDITENFEIAKRQKEMERRQKEIEKQREEFAKQQVRKEFHAHWLYKTSISENNANNSWKVQHDDSELCIESLPDEFLIEAVDIQVLKKMITERATSYVDVERFCKTDAQYFFYQAVMGKDFAVENGNKKGDKELMKHYCKTCNLSFIEKDGLDNHIVSKNHQQLERIAKELHDLAVKWFDEKTYDSDGKSKEEKDGLLIFLGAIKMKEIEGFSDIAITDNFYQEFDLKKLTVKEFVRKASAKRMALVWPKPKLEFYCKFCNYLEFSSKELLDIHLQSTSHKGNQERAACTFCKTCQHNFEDVESYKKHQDGNKHRRANKLYEEVRIHATKYWNLMQLNEPVEQNVRYYFPKYKPPEKTEEQTKYKPPEKTEEQKETEKVKDEQMKCRLFQEKPDEFKLLENFITDNGCQLCLKAFPINSHQIEMHVKSKKHQKKFRQYLEDNKDEFLTPGGCVLCQMSFPCVDPVIIAAHRLSKKHVAKRQAYFFGNKQQ